MMGKLETSGYKGWWPMLMNVGRRVSPDGRRVQVGREVLRNMVTGEIVATEEGWNAEPPAPTGELSASSRHPAYGNEEFWRNMAETKGQTVGEVIVDRPGRLVIRY